MEENTTPTTSEPSQPRPDVDLVVKVAAATPTWWKIERLNLAPSIIIAAGLAMTVMFGNQFGWDLRDSWGFFLIGPALIFGGLLWIMSTPGRMRSKLDRLNAGLTAEERATLAQLAANYAAHTDV